MIAAVSGYFWADGPSYFSIWHYKYLFKRAAATGRPAAIHLPAVQPYIWTSLDTHMGPKTATPHNALATSRSERASCIIHKSPDLSHGGCPQKTQGYVGLMLGLRHRRWPSIKTTLAKHLSAVTSGHSYVYSTTCCSLSEIHHLYYLLEYSVLPTAIIQRRCISLCWLVNYSVRAYTLTFFIQLEYLYIFLSPHCLLICRSRCLMTFLLASVKQLISCGNLSNKNK